MNKRNRLSKLILTTLSITLFVNTPIMCMKKEIGQEKEIENKEATKKTWFWKKIGTTLVSIPLISYFFLPSKKKKKKKEDFISNKEDPKNPPQNLKITHTPGNIKPKENTEHSKKQVKKVKIDRTKKTIPKINIWKKRAKKALIITAVAFGAVALGIYCRKLRLRYLEKLRHSRWWRQIAQQSNIFGINNKDDQTISLYN